MGECCNGALSASQQPLLHSGATLDRRLLKHVFDNVHGNIYLDPLCLKFIDTEQFQRLRDLKQLGLTCMVYPGAVHTRFEHSLGVYWLASESMRCLHDYQGLELDIDHFDRQTVKLAGLLHDVGHGPFSHLFENGFLPQVLRGTKWSHEHMSGRLVDYIVDEHHIDIDCDILGRVKEMIVAGCNVVPKKTKEKQFLYDIVANGRNGIDVDKFDYIGRDSRACGLGNNFPFRRLMESMRIMDDEICYPAKEYLTVHKLFSTRADLHRTVYTHAKVKAIELMLVDALVKANDYLAISSHIHDPAEFWKLDDTIIKAIETAPNYELKESRDLILRIRRRELYQFCNEFAVPKDSLEHFREITAEDIVCAQKATGVTLKVEDVAVCNVKIDLTRGKYNPLESIKFFKDYESTEKFSIPDDRISHLLPASYQDRIVRVYAKKPELVEVISEAFENLQLKMYGMKAQVHETPEKKKRRKKKGQDTLDELHKRNLWEELEERERWHFASMDKCHAGVKREAEDRLIPRSVDADESDVEAKSDDERCVYYIQGTCLGSVDNDDEDHAEALMAELEQIRKERAEEKLQKERQRQEEELKAKKAELIRGNPLLNVKRRWDDDVVFKNQVRGEYKTRSVSSMIP